MAKDFLQKGTSPGPGNLGNNPSNAGPPPSTLAAQLVEDISASTKSSKSDENTELKGLFAIIQRVKDDPKVLKTPEERVEHNHMLIYVYVRVVLDGIKFDDPFLDLTHVRTEVLKAIKFLRFTIKETPAVLDHRVTEGKLMFRGIEPLWVWLLPQLLRFLGHPQCAELGDSIESLLQYFLLVIAQTGSLWDLAPRVLRYLRMSCQNTLTQLRKSPISRKTQEISTPIELPPTVALNQVLDKNWPRTYRQLTYNIGSASQAVQQAGSLVKILMHSLISEELAFDSIATFSESSSWLLDTLHDLRLIQRKWTSVSPDSPVLIIEMILKVFKAISKSKDAKWAFRSKAAAHLVFLCAEMTQGPEDLITLQTMRPEDQHILSMALLAISQVSIDNAGIARLAYSKLVRQLVDQCITITEQSDIWRTIQTLKQVTASPAPESFDEMIHPSKYQDEEIRSAAEALSLAYEVTTDNEDDRIKRRKIMEPEADPAATLVDLLCDTLKLSTPLDGATTLFKDVFLNGFQGADEASQCLALDQLSKSCCMSDPASNARIILERGARAYKCALCDSDVTASQILRFTSNASENEVEQIFSELVHLSSFLESRRPRVAAMIALRRVISHCSNVDVLNLETSPLGQWCLQGLSSSVRELRIASGRTLVTFLLERRGLHASQELIYRNRKNAIAFLRSMSENNHVNLTETCMMAWSQLGRIMDEDELNLVLIKLLEYLGSNNNIVSAIAYNELLTLSEARGVTPRELFQPYWRSLAYMVTKDMVHRPQMSRAVAELLQLSVNELLLVIQEHALPWLVLDRQKDVIQKIADARRDKESWHLIMESANMAPIVALLLIQDPDDIMGFANSRLEELLPNFWPSGVVGLLQSEPVLIVFELLKAAGEADEPRKTTVRKALQAMATSLVAPNRETRQKKGNVIGRFLQLQLLGLMARLTTVINDSLSMNPPIQEQRRCIWAMEEMIKLCKEYANLARPQISTCLLSTVSKDALKEATISCWACMLTHFEEEDIESLLETTFLMISQNWVSLNASAAVIAKKMLTSLLDHHELIITKNINLLPSLDHIPDLCEIESRLQEFRTVLPLEDALEAFSLRIGHENSGVVTQALTELVPYLQNNQNTLYTSATAQQPGTVISTLMRALLDCACKYNGRFEADIPRLCVQAMGLVGCVDPNKIETTREQRSIVILSNFEGGEEVTDFALFLLEVALVPSFLSTTDMKLQGFLSFTMQELLDRTDIRAACAMQNTGGLGGNEIYRKFIALPEITREVAAPFLASRYVLAPMPNIPTEYPIFRPGRSYGNWIRLFVVDLLRKGQNPHADMLFEPLTRVIRVKDLSIAEFIIPYVVLHVFLGSRSDQQEKDQVMGELVSVLQHQLPEDASYLEKEDMKRFCHAVFSVIDYAMRWIQAKRATPRLTETDKRNLSQIQEMLDVIPAELISQRAIDCNEYARALFHLEQHAQKMEQRKREPGERTRLLERLQDIYANIDEPDGLDGISAHLHDFDMNQQILSHRKAGRWTAVQSWYEMQLAEKPDNVDVQVDLLHCLKQAGQHDVLLNHVEGIHTNMSTDNKIMPFAVEAAWVTGKWESLSKFTRRFHEDVIEDFNVSLATIFETLHTDRDPCQMNKILHDMRGKISSSMNASTTASLQACHDLLLQCHVLADVEIIVNAQPGDEVGHNNAMALLDRRLEIIGAFSNDKQYLLGIRRAAMELTRPAFTDFDISGLWLTSAKLARKSNSLHQSFTAVLHASRLGDDAATIENAKLLWIDGHQRKAIQMLQGAIQRNKFMTQTGTSTNTGSTKLNPQQRLLTARAQLLLAKWLDNAGQTHAGALREKYQQPPKTYAAWEKGHYYLGRHYKKILEAEKPLKVDDQSDNYVTGEIARLVIENYVRSLNSGTKYLYQTLPRILTLWLDMGAQVDKPPEGKASLSRELHRRRVEQLSLLHSFLDKYIHRLPAYVFYTALPQIVARIAHPNQSVFDRLTHIIVKVIEAHPRQALWSLIGAMTTKQVTERKARGTQVLQTLRNLSRKVEGTSYDMKYLLRMGERLAEQLLLACQNGDFHSNKTVHASLSRDLRFNHKCTPCPLVVPVESSLTATLPAVSEDIKKHRAFSRDVVSIDCFLDDVLVLSSLAKPRRLTARGTDGKSYMLLIKPKDDLRTDQRLMEFNGIINRSLKRDAESSRRQLYIRTYAVTPLNEECGIIEWVPGIKTMRDILINLYASRKIYPDYGALRQLMDEASMSDNKIRIFTDDVLGRFPPLLHLWFTQQFPNPSTWFAARLRYTRSCAVMSMVGTILGLGDRHGENVNLEEGNGGVFHVDFNCLFDKGLTFAKPERVPFRLTHNMVAAMGIYGYEGPFRKSCELTLSILRQQEETLMTILEAFIYDPTLDLQKEKRTSRRGDSGVKLQPQSVVDSIKRKVKGLLPNESIPLGVEGQVDELIKQAVDPRNLTAMYIGWCPFL